MSTVDISEVQLGLLWHTLGIRPEDRHRRTVTRNYFLTSPGYDDANNLDVLVTAGLMTCGKPPAFCDQSEVVYRATRDGERVALGKLPLLPKLTRYEQFLNADIDCTFAEWLGIEKPTLEFRGSSWWGKDRKFRFSTSRATGEWCPTQKEAKASYKAALKNAAPREKRNDFDRMYAGL
jgi:hypothetical protein